MTEQFPEDSPQLPDEQYHLLVAPVLEVTAKIAAARGDLDLYNDMPSMLALRTLVGDLVDLYLRDHPDVSGETRTVLENAPESACLMPLQRGNLSDAQLADCVYALKAATDQLVDAGVLDGEREAVAEVWRLLTAGNRKAATERLQGIAIGIATDIDAWERKRDSAPAQ